MKLTLTAYDLTVTVHDDSAVSTSDLTNLCASLLLAAGHDPCNVADAFAEWGTERGSVWNKSLDTDAEPV